MDALGLGEERGSYAISGVGGGLAQLARRSIVGLYVVILVALVVSRPPAAFTSGAVAGAVVLALFSLTLAWRRASAKFGIKRCYLYTGGLVVTNLFGRMGDVVAWTEVTALNRMESQSVLLAFHRVEFVRRSSASLAFVVPGLKPALMEALLSQATENGIS
jgi:hypothetical protein